MTRIFAVAGTFAVLLASAGIYLMPATWIDSVLQSKSRGVLSLGDPRGRIWEGSGVLQAMLPRGEVMTIDRMGWTVVLREMFLGRIHINLFSIRTGKPVVDATLGISGLTFHSAQLELPAALLGSISSTVREAALTGKLALKLRDFRFVHQQFGGTADIVWSDAASGLVSVSPLGNYKIEIKGDLSGLGCRISTLNDAAMKLAGKCRQSPDQPFSIDATAEPAQMYRRELAPLLRVIGKEIRPGVYQLQVDPNLGIDPGLGASSQGSKR